MNKTQPSKRLSRRDFVKLTALAGLATMGGYVLSEYSPWLDFEGEVEHMLRPFEQDATLPAQMRELVRYATLAANGHNTQPWMFVIRESTIEIHPDYMRRLPVVDPHDRELWISLGCALENLLVAARRIGYAPEVTYPNVVDFIQIRLSEDRPHVSPLFDAIPQRQNTRSEFDGRSVKTADLDQVQNLSLEPGVTLRLRLRS